MKKALSLILSLLIAVSVFAAAPVSAVAADDYDYTVDDSGNATITKYTGDQPAPVGGVVEPIQVEIPSELDGNTVTEIGDRHRNRRQSVQRYLFCRRDHLSRHRDRCRRQRV